MALPNYIVTSQNQSFPLALSGIVNFSIYYSISVSKAKFGSLVEQASKQWAGDGLTRVNRSSDRSHSGVSAFGHRAIA
jgi:hypothetical protein